MSDDLQRRWPGRGPWDEVWFLELSLPDGGSAWLRYTLADGPHRRGLTTWAIVTDPSRGATWADQSHHRLSALHPRDAVRTDELVLSRTQARGHAGGCRWDLVLELGPRRHRMVPALVEALGVGRTYAVPGLDLQLSGDLWAGDRHWKLDRCRAVLGHIWGASNRTRGWAWCHAHFPGDDVLVECLAARLGPLPTLTSLGVWIGGEHLDLSGARHLLRARTRVGATTLKVRTFTRTARIELCAELPTEPRSVVRYLDPGDGGERTCTNSARGRVELVVTRGDRVDRYLTDHAAFEVAERGRGTAAVLLSD
mgnify:CR=1 FL=1